MQTHRFFIPPKAIDRATVRLTDSQAHQIINVLRLTPGNTIQVLDNSGWQYEAEISRIEGGAVTARILSRTLVDTEPRTKITIYQGLLKAAKLELILQKCTELGAVGFVPVITERSVVGNIRDVSEGKVERWNKIISEAAEQSGRGRLPVLREAMMFQQACEQVHGLSLIAWEGEKNRTIRDALRGKGGAEAPGSRQRPFSINLFFGPEGGFSQDEIDTAVGYGLVPVSLGRRILRAETATVTATALVLYEMGDMVV